MEGSEVINFSSVERELKAAIEFDKKYQRENDAKFRALRQNVGSYEEFRDIVLASHLKPLERKDVAGAPRKQPWNPISCASKQDTVCPEEKIEAEQSLFQPKTASEFHRNWRRLGWSTEKKYKLLIFLGGKNLQQIFSVEIGLGLLGEFLLIIAKCLRAGDEPEVLAVLEGLSKTCRFSLNVSFLEQAEKEACMKLFHRLLAVSDGQCFTCHTGDKICGRTCEQTTEAGETQGCKHTQNSEGGQTCVMKKVKTLMQLYDVTLPCLQ